MANERKHQVWADRRERVRHNAWVLHQTKEDLKEHGPRFPDWVPFRPDVMLYHCQGREIGKEGGYHLQGYTKWTKAFDLTVRKRLIGNPHVHFEEVTVSNAAHNRAYCNKLGKNEETGEFFGEKPPGDFIENGQIPTPGKSLALREVTKRIRDGESIRDIAIETTEYDECLVRNLKSLRSFQAMLHDDQKLRVMPKVIICVGPPGAGKSACCYSWVAANEPKWRVFMVPCMKGNVGQGWFDGYQEHDVILFDNVDRGFGLDYDVILKICDRYPFKVPVKGDFVPLHRLKMVWFTSVHDPIDWWGHGNGSDYIRRAEISEFERRIASKYSVARINPDDWQNVRLESVQEVLDIRLLTEDEILEKRMTSD